MQTIIYVHTVKSWRKTLNLISHYEFIVMERKREICGTSVLFVTSGQCFHEYVYFFVLDYCIQIRKQLMNTI